MSFLLRLCLGLIVLVPSLVHAATLENPGDDLSYSGIGVISGWKCEANGSLTARFFDADMMPVGNPVPLAYLNERSDTSGVCGDTDNGFVSIWNWGNLSDGTYTAVAYDNDEEFARSTFTVTTLGTEFLTGASGECRVPNFPTPGETTTFEWNQNTQHLEAVSRESSYDLGTCRVGLTVDRGEMCSGSINFGGREIGFTFSVDADGRGCVEAEIGIDIPCVDTGEEFENFLSIFGVSGASITRNADDSWTINSFPSIL